VQVYVGSLLFYFVFFYVGFIDFAIFFLLSLPVQVIV